MEIYSLLKTQQWLVLLCLLSGFTRFLKTPVAKAQIQHSQIPFGQENTNYDLQSLRLAYADDHIALFFETALADSEIIAQLIFTPVSESDTWKFKDKINYSTPTGKESPTIYVIKHELNQSNIKKLQTSQSPSPSTSSNSQNNVCSCMPDDTTDPVASKIRSEVEAAKNTFTQSYGREINPVLEWEILDMLVYDSFFQLRNIETVQDFLKEVINTTSNFPQENVTLFSDWYLPIYENHGGNESIRDFMNLLKSYSTKNSSNYYLSNKTLNAGEFVHIWSEATGTDLRDLAYKAFGWTPDYRTEYEVARKTFMTYNYSDVYPNASWYAPPEFWEEHWKGHASNLTRIYYDEHVAFYYDESVPSFVTWPHQLLSDAWRYAKKTYGPFGPDPMLYIVLHAGKQNSCWKSKSNSYFDKTFDHHLVIDCENVEGAGWEKHSYWNLFYLIEGVGAIITNVVTETGNWPALYPGNGYLFHILIYDIYLGMGRMEDAEMSLGFNYMSWFRGWFYPIYIKYGGTKVLKDFFALVYLNWPRKGTDYVGNMNDGEFVHFWSAAARQDFRSLATKALKWREKYSDELVQARIDYPQLNQLYTIANTSLPQTWTESWENHDKELNLVHSDVHVAIYFDSGVNASVVTWPFRLMSDSWKYATETYGPLSYDPVLYIILHENTSGCLVSKLYSYFDVDYGNRNVIDCGQEFVNAWNSNSSANKDLLMTKLGLMILRIAKETGNWPEQEISRCSMGSILVYDIYRGLGMMMDAERWREKMFKETEEVPAENTFWFRDWYYPIYEKYGQSHALNGFLSALNANWPHEDQDYIKIYHYNMGVMVHFWSIAVGKNLWQFADKAFGCCTWDQQTYLKARKDFPNFSYTDTTDNSTVMIPSEKWIDPENKFNLFNRELNLVHVDSHLAVYVDSKVKIILPLPFKTVSEAWLYTKKIYGPLELGTILSVLILETVNYYVCQASQEKNLENLKEITCHTSLSDWSSSNGLQVIVPKLSYIALQEAKQTGYWPAMRVSGWIMKNIIAYDIFHEIGMPLDALTWLESHLAKSINVPQKDKDTFWMREWFYPIYTKYGGAKVMNDFLSLLSEQWPKNPKGSGYDYAKQLNVGEFVHFWSGAAGVNLVHLANKTFGWNHEYSMQLGEAMQTFPMITYNDFQDVADSDSGPSPILLTEGKFGHSKLLLKAYGSSKVAVYFDADVNRTIKWPFDLLSKTWTQTKLNFDTVQNTLDPILKIFLHGTKQTGCKTTLKLPNNTDSTSILDCGKESKWATNTEENRDELIQGFAKLIQRSAKQTEGREPYDPKPFFEILAFDVYLRLGNLEDARRLLTKAYIETEIQAGEEKFYIRDWYLPLYTQYGGVAILNNFVSLLSTNWTQEGQGANKKISVGQTIHFWSAAAGENLNLFAEQVFGRNHLYQEQFSEARKDFPLLNYSCYDCQLNSNGTQTTESENHALITGFSVGFVCILIAAVVLPLLIYRTKLNILQRQMRELTPEEIKEFFEGNDKVDQGDGNLSIESKPFNKDYEISRDRLDIDFDSVLGCGEFGLVFRGTLRPTSGPGKESVDTPVAVKTAKPNVDVTYFKPLLMELKVMGFLGSHPNIVSLLGAFTVNIRNREVYMALEFCSNGDLLSFLKQNRACFKDLLIKKVLETSKVKSSIESRISISLSLNSEAKTVVDNAEFTPIIIQDVNTPTFLTQNDELRTITTREDSIESGDAFSNLDLLEWSCQIASGMAFIASKKVIHGDLSARNVLLTAGNVAKISDFGLSRQLANYSNYMKTSETPVPWRWMAIESLRDMNFSVQSDAWSFGVTLYEIFSLGTTPYAGRTWNCEFIDQLVAGHRLSAPEFGNEDVYKLMMDCMQKEPSERSSFPQMIRRLDEIKDKILRETDPNISSGYVRLEV